MQALNANVATNSTHGAQEITLQDLYAAWQSSEAKLFIVDVRKPADHGAGSIPGSVNIPMASISERADELRGRGPIYFHCYAGPGAKKVATTLAEEGVDNVLYVGQGGFSDWQAAGYPVNS